MSTDMNEHHNKRSSKIGTALLHWTARKSYKRLLKFLLAIKWGDVHAKDSAGKTALDLAKENGHKEVAEFLHTKGVVEGIQSDLNTEKDMKEDINILNAQLFEDVQEQNLKADLCAKDDASLDLSKQNSNIDITKTLTEVTDDGTDTTTFLQQNNRRSLYSLNAHQCI